MKLQERVALITGAGSGIGRAVAQLFAAEGARVVVNDLNALAATQTVESLGARAAAARAITAIVVGLLLGAPLFGSVLEASDSYGAAWGTFAGLCVAVATVMALLGGAIHREYTRPRDQT